MNHVELRGTLVRDAELAYLPSGVAVLEMQLAGTDRVQGEDGEVRELPWYHRVTVFGEHGENLVDALSPGVAAYVIGHLRYRAWESRDGSRRSDVDVVADTTRVLGLPAPDQVTQDARGQDRLNDATNRVLVAGNATRDAELRYTPSGYAVLDLGLAVNDRPAQQQGAREERTHFLGVTAWRELAETHAELAKGTGVVAIGRLVRDSWEGRDGRRHYRTKIEAAELFPTVAPRLTVRDPLARPTTDDADAADAELPF